MMISQRSKEFLPFTFYRTLPRLWLMIHLNLKTTLKYSSIAIQYLVLALSRCSHTPNLACIRVYGSFLLNRNPCKVNFVNVEEKEELAAILKAWLVNKMNDTQSCFVQ